MTGEVEHGLHLCLIAPTVGDLTWTGKTRLGRLIEGRYYPFRSEARIRATVDGELLGEVNHKPPGVDWFEEQFVQFDTRRRAGGEAALRLELQGGALACFDFRKVP